MRTTQIRNLGGALVLLAALSTFCAASAQVAPILPTDVTGPMVGGGGIQNLLNNIGDNYYGYGTTGNISGRILTNPVVIPYNQQQVQSYPTWQCPLNSRLNMYSQYPNYYRYQW